MKDIQATGGAFSPQKRTTRNSKHEISFLFLWVNFALLDSDPVDKNVSADPCGYGSTTLFILYTVPVSRPSSQKIYNSQAFAFQERNCAS
jgi:hypothetical protein